MTHRVVSPDRVAPAALITLAIVTAVVVLVEGRGTTFFFDEWDFLLTRRGHDADDLLRGQNGNCSVFPVLLFKALLQAVGADSYWAFRTVLLSLHLVVVALVWLLLRRRSSSVLAAVGAALVLVMGQSPDNLLWPAQFGFLLATIGGLAGLALLERRDPLGAVGACTAFVLALGSSSAGVPFWVAGAVLVLLADDRVRRLWILGLPLVLYGLWSLRYGDPQVKADNISLTPAFAETMAATAGGAAVGLSAEFGRTVVLLLALGLGIWSARGGRWTPFLVAPALGLLVLWVLTGFARADLEAPTATRYAYGAVILGLLAAAVIAGRRFPARALWPAVALTAFAALSGWGSLHGRGVALRGEAAQVQAVLAAIDVAQPYVPAEARPFPRQGQIIAGPVVLAQRDFGRIGMSRSALISSTPEQRALADQVLLSFPLVSQSLPGQPLVGAAPPLEVAVGVRTSSPASGCLRITPKASPAAVVLAAPAGRRLGVRSDEPVGIRLRRFADAFPETLQTTLKAPAEVLALRADAGTDVPWRVELNLSAAVTVCELG